MRGAELTAGDADLTLLRLGLLPKIIQSIICTRENAMGISLRLLPCISLVQRRTTMLRYSQCRLSHQWQRSKTAEKFLALLLVSLSVRL